MMDAPVVPGKCGNITGDEVTVEENVRIAMIRVFFG
jgi:hypothetical protein